MFYLRIMETPLKHECIRMELQYLYGHFILKYSPMWINLLDFKINISGAYSEIVLKHSLHPHSLFEKLVNA